MKTARGTSSPGDSSPAGSSSHEADLLRQAQAGDRTAFGRLASIFQDRLYNAVLRMVGDHEEARELTQETFVRGLAAVASFRGQSGPYTWLFRIATNLTITHFRKVTRRRTFSLDAPPTPRDGLDGQSRGLADRLQQSRDQEPPAQIQRREEAQQVIAALGRIEPEQRAILVMRDVEGFDYQQIADVLEQPLGTVKSRLFRARVALREQLKDYYQ